MDKTTTNSEKKREMKPYRLPSQDICFICGPGSGSGLDVTFYFDGETIQTSAILDERHQGPPGHAHGGVLMSLLDESMGTCAWALEYKVLAAHVEVDFKSPVPLKEKITVTASVTGKEGRKVFTEGKIFLSEGKLAAVSRGVFVESGKFFEEAIAKRSFDKEQKS